MKVARKRRKVGNTYYRWDLWLDGHTHDLRHKRDYPVSNACFRAAVEYQCRKRGLSFSLLQSGDRKSVRLTAMRVINEDVAAEYKAQHPRKYKLKKRRKVWMLNYPWDRWLNKKTHTLRRGIDYKCSPAMFRKACEYQAKQRVLRVSIKFSPEGIRLTARGLESES